jgi:hypothetical protein
MRKRGFESSRIAIDVTGGQKTASIAGAVLTLNRSTVVQYVQTEAREEIEAYIYDLRLDSPPEFGHA